MGVAAAFVLGGCATTTVLGITSALAGRVFMALGSWPVYLLSTLPIVFGLHLLGVVRLPLPSRTADLSSMKGSAGAAVAGALVGLAVLPCATPVLGGILAYVARTADPVWGGLLLFSYGLGTRDPGPAPRDRVGFGCRETLRREVPHMGRLHCRHGASRCRALPDLVGLKQVRGTRGRRTNSGLPQHRSHGRHGSGQGWLFSRMTASGPCPSGDSAIGTATPACCPSSLIRMPVTR